jgi:hypothetical protein
MVPHSLTIAKKRRGPGVSRRAKPQELEDKALVHAGFIFPNHPNVPLLIVFILLLLVAILADIV